MKGNARGKFCPLSLSLSSLENKNIIFISPQQNILYLELYLKLRMEPFEHLDCCNKTQDM
jgi:hypothetical protein